jgi:hypothetical protein
MQSSGSLINYLGTYTGIRIVGSRWHDGSEHTWEYVVVVNVLYNLLLLQVNQSLPVTILMFLAKLLTFTATLRPTVTQRCISTSLSRRSDALFVVGAFRNTCDPLLNPSY